MIPTLSAMTECDTLRCSVERLADAIAASSGGWWEIAGPLIAIFSVLASSGMVVWQVWRSNREKAREAEEVRRQRVVKVWMDALAEVQYRVSVVAWGPTLEHQKMQKRAYRLIHEGDMASEIYERGPDVGMGYQMHMQIKWAVEEPTREGAKAMLGGAQALLRLWAAGDYAALKAQGQPRSDAPVDDLTMTAADRKNIEDAFPRRGTQTTRKRPSPRRIWKRGAKQGDTD
jgi:hypothetical protein